MCALLAFCLLCLLTACASFQNVHMHRSPLVARLVSKRSETELPWGERIAVLETAQDFFARDLGTVYHTIDTKIDGLDRKVEIKLDKQSGELKEQIEKMDNKMDRLFVKQSSELNSKMDKQYGDLKNQIAHVDGKMDKQYGELNKQISYMDKQAGELNSKLDSHISFMDAKMDKQTVELKNQMDKQAGELNSKMDKQAGEQKNQTDTLNRLVLYFGAYLLVACSVWVKSNFSDVVALFTTMF